MAKRCPTCGKKLVPVLYGYPDSEDFEEANRGEIVIGGCMVGDFDPVLACPRCDRAVIRKPEER
ncbi:MAG: hypothetical protein V9E85_08590 [Candidatus Nanopelagicales bacterium]|jgi:DNA-directed RNA polymerase subunit RPC12/RpoP